MKLLRGCGFGVLCMVSAAIAHAEPPLDKPAFTATPRELLDVAKATPGTDLVVLRENHELAIDDQGRFTRTVHRVVSVRSDLGALEGGVGGEYRPSYQDRPRMRARLIEPSGRETPLVQSAITEEVHGDYASLEGSLPDPPVGSVIETEVVTQDRLPMLAAGGFERVNAATSASARIVLSAPAGRSIRVVARDLPAGVSGVHTRAGGRETWTYSLGPLVVHVVGERHAAADTPANGPQLALVTAASWAAVARDYRAVVDRRIAAGPWPLAPGLPRAPTLEAVRAITAWLHRAVRSAEGENLQFAERTPASPAETAKRGAGGELAKATLLVALLRQVGLRADLALIKLAPWTDVALDLPGLGDFDRVLVRALVAGRAVWIDVADDLLAIGQLPATAQGRRALIIAADTTALAATPASQPKDNTVRQVRTYELSEAASATRVTEVAREGGAFEAAQRLWIRDTTGPELADGLATYAKTEYLATYDRHTTTPPTDLATPFSTTIVAKDCGRGFTSIDQIEVSLFAWDVFEKVPDVLTEKDAPTEARRADLQWPVPHVMEIENRVVVPPGYTLPAVRPDKTTPLGTAVLTERHRLDGRTYVVTFRFDSGKPRLAAAEVELMRRAMREVAGTITELKFPHTGIALGEAGKSKLAIAELERLIKLHPAEAGHHAELAYVFMRLGMGEAARREARRGVELEPASADAHAILGWALRHDTLGRVYGSDHDRAGALAAYATARRLKPGHLGAAVEQGDLLHRDAQARPYRGDLARAAEALRVAHTIEATEERATALVAVLVRSGGLAEAERVLRALPQTMSRDAALVAVIAAGSGGAQAAIRLAHTLYPPAAAKPLLEQVGATMLSLRRYDTMRAVFAQVGGTPANLKDEVVAKLATHTRVPLGRDPRDLVFELARYAMDPAHPATAFWDARTALDLTGPTRLQNAPPAGIDELVFEDIMYSVTKVRAIGSEAAWRLEADIGPQPAYVYAALDRGIAKIIATSTRMYGLGRHALRLVDRNDLATAATCLDWALHVPASAMVIDRIWGPGMPRDREAITLAAAVLAAGTDPARTLPITTRCASKQPGARAACDQAMAYALVEDKRWAELDAHTTAWTSRAAGQRAAHDAGLARLEALLGLRRYDEADHLLDALIAAQPDDPDFPRNKPRVSFTRGSFAEGVQRYDAVLLRGDLSSNDQNNAAWARILAEIDPRGAFDLATKAVGANKDTAASSAVHTLASAEAELGDFLGAVRDGGLAMARGDRYTPNASDLYLVGRVAELLGLRADAITYYRRATATGVTGVWTSAGLAARRLAKLGSP